MLSVHNSWRWVAAAAVAAVLLAGCGSDDDGDASGDGTSAGSFDAEEYFGGKTIRMLVTSSAGGNTDLFGRFIAKELESKIPGQPRIAVTNEGGLGGMANVFEAPESDLVIGATSRSSSMYGTADDPEAKHVPSEVQVIGGIAGDPRAWTGFGKLVGAYDSLADAAGGGDVPLRFAATVGAAGEVESDVFLYSWLCENMDLPCEYINVADDSSSDINLMVQRGEVNIQGGTMITMMRDYLGQIQEGDAELLLEYAQPEENVIPLPEGVESHDIKDILPEELKEDYEKILPIISSGLLGNMLWAGPDVPAEAVAALQDAYAEVVGDEATIQELNGIMAGGDSPYKYAVTPLSGAAAQEAFDTSAGNFEDNQNYINGLREEYVELWE
jgi:hypothetical protein